MNNEELAALKLKYEGKVARLLEYDSDYDNYNEVSRGLVEEIHEEGWGDDLPYVRFGGEDSSWYFNDEDREYSLELHPHYEE